MELLNMIAAVIFDFDGVIADTEPLHYQVFQEVLAGYGIGFSWEEYVERYMGYDDRDAFREAFKNAGYPGNPEQVQELIRLKADIFNARARGDALAPYPGVVNLVTELADHVPLAVCSGALRSDIRPILKSVGLSSLFPVLVTADDTRKGKPDPEGYELAMQRLSEREGRTLAASRSWAIEDTPDGIRSAHAAGLKVLAVTNSHPADLLQTADHVVSSLESVNRVALAKWLEHS